MKKGFSLTEIVIVVGIFGLIAIALGTFNKDVFLLSFIARDSIESVSDAESLMRVMAKELRTAAPGDNGGFPIISASTSTITFYTDSDGNGTHEKIRYFVNGLDLKRGIVQPSGQPATYVGTESVKTLMKNVRNGTTSMFLYYNVATGTPLTMPVDPAKIKLVEVNVFLDANVQRAPAIRKFTTKATIRNLRVLQ